MEKEILLRAKTLFFQLGFKSVTMDDIARDMSISKKTIYEIFENKTILIERCVEGLFLETMQGIKEIRTHQIDPIQELFIVKKRVVQLLDRTSQSARFQLQKYYPEIHSSLERKKLEILGGIFQESIQDGVQRGLFREAIDPDFVTRVYFNGISGFQDIHLFPEERFDFEYCFESFIEYHLRAISTPKGIALLERYKSQEHKLHPNF